MKQKSVLFIAFFVMLVILLGVIAPVSNAATTLYLGITELRKNDTPNFGYAIGNPNTNGSSGNAAKIWNILEYTGTGSNAQEKANGYKNIYCVKAGVGFSDTRKRAEYNVSFDMKTEREKIKAQNDTLKSIVEGNVNVDGNKTVSKYDALLALSDLLYLIDDENDNNVKVAYLEKAGITSDAYTYLLTRDDIAAVQQAAIWYFTNYGEENGKYDKTQNTGWLNYTTDGLKYTSLGDYNLGTNEGRMRQEQAEILYNYLIKTAKANADKYSNSTNTSGAPVQINTKTLNYQEDGSNYIVGPINMTSTGSSLPYTIDFAVKNGQNTISNYKLLNSNKQEVAQGTTVEKLVGQDFYILVPKENVSTISVSININYSDTKLTLWASTTNNQEQPVMIPEKTPKSVSLDLTVKPNEKPFDLALRKYITKVNGTALSENNSRVPNVDESTLASGTTATYKHKKDPVMVKTGDVVTYKITIYNEGQASGRATKVVDQLPTGLKFSKVVSGNFVESSYDESTNKLNLERKSGNNDNLNAYTQGKLESETIEIECTVEAKPDNTNKKVLTNVAWIAEEVNSETNVTITNQNGLDRDSEPATTPNVNKDNMENYNGNDNKEDLTDKNYYYKGQQDDDDFEKLVLMPESFDLKLIKRIVSVNDQQVPERIQKVDVSKLNTLDENGKLITTGDYKLNKDPVQVKKGDIVTYTFRIYNEGTIDGYASEITEDVPDGLEFLWSEKEGDELNSDTSLTDSEKQAIAFNQKYLWSKFKYNDSKDKITQISSSYLSKDNETTVGENLIKAFGSNDGSKTEADIHYKELSVKFKVTSDSVGTAIRNEAAITDDSDENGNSVDDRDSSTDKWVKYEDDEDYDNIILQEFDLALRKFIIAVSDDETLDSSDYLKNADGSYQRAPIVDTSYLNTAKSALDISGATTGLIRNTTAIYKHPKTPVVVKRNDMVVYMLRVYNEGEINGYASEIKDHLPSNLQFVDNDYNKKYGWTVSEDGRTVTTNYLANHLVKKAEKDSSGKYVLSYVEVPIMCKVTDNAKAGENITNIADITEYKDEDNKDVVDRDSQANNVQLPKDEELPGYKDNEKEDYIPGQQDDDDFEKVVVKEFDLALRKFITKVDDKDVTTRIPQVSYDKDKNHITYNHTKDPVQVVNGNVVTYTIRVFNEGDINGYASLITDDIPEGLQFIPDNDTNKEYRWVMYDKDGKETTDTSKAVKIQTDYLSKAQEKAEGSNLLKAFNPDQEISDTNPDHKDVQVAFKVIEPNGSSKVLVNSAQISDDTDENGKPVDDKDSIPDKWNEGEDDQDREYVKLSNFDLALRKWVTQAIVTDKNGTKITETGHQPYDDPEEIVKVDLNRKHINDVTVKFRYSIRVINEGEIAGYAKEVKDYIPEGLKFVAADNPQWTQAGDNIITTKALENKLLQPGEYADVEVVLTWINNADNMGLKVNTAEISKDYNDFGIPDKDSTPDNKKAGEDDIDDAPVMLSVSTGTVKTYFALGGLVLITFAGGIMLIKKYIL